MRYYILFLFISFAITAQGAQILQTKEREMLLSEKNVVDMIEKYHKDEKFNTQVTSLRNLNTETNYFTSISVTFKSTSDPAATYIYNALTRSVSYSKTEGKAMEITGYFLVTNDDLFKHERICGSASCESTIYKNGIKIYPSK